MYVGIDWAKQAHEVCAVDAAGTICHRATIPHSQDGLDQLVGYLRRWATQTEGELLVGIERPEGRLVDRILEAGYPILLVPTFAMKDLRRRYSVGGAKSDRGDCYVLADVARTDGHRLRRLEPLSPQTRALRAAVRTRDDLVDQRKTLANQLRATLEAYWPGAAAIFADVDSEICLAFLCRYPTPESAARLTETRLASFLTKAGYSGRRPPAQLLARLCAAPAGVLGIEAEARADTVRAMVRVLRALLGSIKDLDRSVVAHLGEHPDAKIFTTLPRSGQINAAQLLAEWGDCRQAYPQADSVATLEPVPGHPRLRPPPRRQLPVGLQQAAATSHDDLRQQLPTRLAVGGRGLPAGHRPRLRPPARRADPRPRVGAGHLAVLAGPHTLRPGPPPSRPPSQSRVRLTWEQAVAETADGVEAPLWEHQRLVVKR